MRLYSVEQIAWLKEHVMGRSRQELADAFNAHFCLELTPSQIKSACARHGLRSGRDCRFPPGNTPHNTGVKGFGAGAAGKGAQATRFRKGNLPWNYRPVGSERRTTPHRRDGYYQIDVKIADPNVWKAKHLLVWEAAHGPVPPGHVLLFADQDRENCTLENLILVSRRELAVLNKRSLISDDADLTSTGLNVAKLILLMNERKGRKTPKVGKEHKI
jgi:hypothetical protein